MNFPFMAEGAAFWLAHSLKPETKFYVTWTGVLISEFQDGAETIRQIECDLGERA